MKDNRVFVESARIFEDLTETGASASVSASNLASASATASNSHLLPKTFSEHDRKIINGLNSIPESPYEIILAATDNKYFTPVLIDELIIDKTGQYIDPEDYISLVAYQPTLRGLPILTLYYEKKYGVKIMQKHKMSFMHFIYNPPVIFETLKTLKDYNNKIGFIFRYPSGHLVPFFFQKKDDIIYVVNLDSSPSKKKKEHEDPTDLASFASFANFASRTINNIKDRIEHLNGRDPELAEFLKNIKFRYLELANIRQFDEYSCVTDAVIMLKDILRLPDPLAAIFEKNRDLKLDKKMVKTITQKELDGLPNIINRLPEDLLKTAQNKKFLKDSDPNFQKILKTTKDQALTLDEKRQKHQIAKARIEIPKTPDRAQYVKDVKDANLFLYQKSKKYAEVICQYLELSEVNPGKSLEDIMDLILERERLKKAPEAAVAGGGGGEYMPQDEEMVGEMLDIEQSAAKGGKSGNISPEFSESFEAKDDDREKTPLPTPEQPLARRASGSSDKSDKSR